MANEEKKDFNAMLLENRDMPKIQIITDSASIKKYGGEKMYFAPPADYDAVMRTCTVNMNSPSTRMSRSAKYARPI